MSIGAIVLFTTSLYLHNTQSHIEGFTTILPADATALYVEAETNVAPELKKMLADAARIDFKRDIEPWIGATSAIAFLELEEGLAAPYVITEVRDSEGARRYLTEKEKAFLVIDDVFVIADSSEHLARFADYQKNLTPLSKDKNFIRLRQKLLMPFFLYMQGATSRTVVQKIEDSLVPNALPLSNLLTAQEFQAIALGASFDGTRWQGRSIALTETELSPRTELSYSAALLPYLPQDFDIFFGGGSGAQLLENISPQLLDATLAKLLPGLTFSDITPLLSHEYGVTMEAGKILAVVHSSPAEEKLRDAVRRAFKKAAPLLVPTTQAVTLPDGSTAEELIPDTEAGKETIEEFDGVAIHSVALGKAAALFDVVTEDIWFISNNLISLKKALLLRREPGRNIRDSSAYRHTLQPIMRSPELVGIAMLYEHNALEKKFQLPWLGTFGFSKKTVGDRMETDFIFYAKNPFIE